MEIDEIEIRHTKLDLARPFETSFGRFKERHPLIVKITSGDFVGYGEAPTLRGPFYTSETTEGAFHVLKEYVSPKLVGKNIESPKNLNEKLSFIRGNNIALSGIDTAFHVLLAKKKGVSLANYLGGKKKKIPCGVSIGFQRDGEGNISTNKLLSRVEEMIDKSYRRIKIKIKPGYDIEPVKAIREKFGPDLPLQVDANSSYTLNEIDRLKKLDNYGLSMIEQPLSENDLIFHSKLQSQINTPICLDESIKSFNDTKNAIELGSAEIINLKLSRVGGLHTAKKIHDYCQRKDVPLWCGGMLESAIGVSHSIAMASLPNFKLPADISPSQRYFKQDFIKPFIELKNGYVNVPKSRGLGYKLDHDFLNKATLKKEIISS